MSNHRDIRSESRTLTLQAAVFRALRDRGLEPELSDTSAERVQPADTLHAQMVRTIVGSDIVAHLRTSMGLAELERQWLYRVVDAACLRHERQEQERQRQTLARRSIVIAQEPVVLASTNTATATTVVFRRRNGDSHG